MYDLGIAGVLGFIFVTMIDRIWFKIDYKKAEKGLEILEHYHWGILLLAIAPFFINYSLVTSFGLLGMGTAFIYHEAKQKNFFSYDSKHFRLSALIGIVIAIFAIITYFLIPTIFV